MTLAGFQSVRFARIHFLHLAAISMVAFSDCPASAVTAESAFLYSGGDFTPFSYPGATETRPFAINDNGDIAGWYADGSHNVHGFVLTGNTFTSIDHPAASGPFGTSISGINNSGVMVGHYHDGVTSHGIVYAHGAFSSFNFPGAISTQPFKINNHGDIVGSYWDGTATHSFLYSNGTFSTLNVPGLAYAINDLRQVVGYFDDNGHHSYGYLYSEGAVTLLGLPGARYSSAYGINNRGEIVGTADADAFTYFDGDYHTLNPPLSRYSHGHGINNLGQIVGYSILVPEPASVLFVCLGLIGLMAGRSSR